MNKPNLSLAITSLAAATLAGCVGLAGAAGLA